MYTFLGLIRCEFNAQDTGERIEGWNLWLAEPAEAPSSGLRPVKKWLSNEKCSSIFSGIGGVIADGTYAGTQVELQVGLRGQVMSLKFPQK